MIKEKYLEILETRSREEKAVKDIIFLRGKREDLEILLHFLIDGKERHQLIRAENTSYVEIKHIPFNKTERLRLAECLSGNGWTLKTSNFSCVTESDMNIEFVYRDLWVK